MAISVCSRVLVRLDLKLAWALLLALVLAGGCSDDEGTVTQLVISVEADATLSQKLTRVDVETYDTELTDESGKPKLVGEQSFALKTQDNPKGYSFPFSFGALKNKADEFLLVVIGFEGDNAVIEHKARAGFVDGQSRLLKVVLSSRCYQKLCAERNTSEWFQTTCDSEQSTCGGVTMTDTVITGGEDASTPDTDGSVESEAGSNGGDGQGDSGNGSANDSGVSMDGSVSNTADAGAMDGASNASDGAQQLDTGSSASDGGGAKDTGPLIDAQPVSCGTLTCPATANCVSSPTPHCECKPGYQGSGTTCTNVNDCTATSCAAPSTCVDGVGDFSCTCAAGYFQVNTKSCAPQFTSLASGGDSVGGGTNCARRTNGSVACWGRNIQGQFGNGTAQQDINVPVVVDALNNVAEIAIGSNFACSRRSDGTVWCSGYNGAGQLGRGATGDSSVPVQVMGLTGVVELAAGSEHICARRSTGTVACWGANDSGELGNGMAGQGMRSLAPVDVIGLSNAVEIAAGVYHSCARRSEAGGGSSVVCWGSNSSGQLGNGTSGGNSGGALVQVSTGAGSALVNPIGLALGEWHSCALLMSGSVACWGSDSSGQLGNAGSSATVPELVTGISTAVEVAANRFYSCARLANGSVSCWGDWPGTSTTSVQTKVASGALEIGAGYLHTCVRKTDGNIVCWGQNNYGQLGNGVTAGDADPYTVTPVTVRAY